jgi:hypothetical protein
LKNRKPYIIPSLLLAVLLLFGNAPKEFVHLFANHQDTVHTHHNDGDLSFEPEHHHCEFLSYALPLFLASDGVPQIHFSPKICYLSTQRTNYQSPLQRADGQLILLRGPPALA